ncbi:MAG: hypothetical protein AAFX99_28005, partial [Myxococcota bacterium]
MPVTGHVPAQQPYSPPVTHVTPIVRAATQVPLRREGPAVDSQMQVSQGVFSQGTGFHSGVAASDGGEFSVPGYNLVKVLGRGGMGEVFLASRLSSAGVPVPCVVKT